MNQAQVESLLTTSRAGREADRQLLTRAREVFRVIQRFNLVAANDLDRIKTYRSAYLCECSIDQLPADPIFAGEEWHRAEVRTDGVLIVSRHYAGNNEYDYHHHTLTFLTLWQTNEQIEAALRASLTAYLKEVDDHETRKAAAEEQEAREQFEALKERFASQ